MDKISSSDLSWQYVNFMNWMCVCVCVGGEHWCLALVWGSYYVLVFLGIVMGWEHMCILIAIPGLLINGGLLTKFHALISVKNPRGVHYILCLRTTCVHDPS